MKPDMTCFSLLASDDKGEALARSAANTSRGLPDSIVFTISPTAFAIIPGAPFAYWTDESVRRVFRDFDTFDDELSGRATRCGLGTLDDFRFLRLCWEVPPLKNGWRTYYHGGVFSPFYDTFPLLVQWEFNGS